MPQSVQSVGVTGSYPNGGFPAQAFYGVMGTTQAASPTVSGGSMNNPLGVGSSKTAILVTVLILVFGGYYLWHKTW